jgi:hypothetical protein
MMMKRNKYNCVDELDRNDMYVEGSDNTTPMSRSRERVKTSSSNLRSSCHPPSSPPPPPSHHDEMIPPSFH